MRLSDKIFSIQSIIIEWLENSVVSRVSTALLIILAASIISIVLFFTKSGKILEVWIGAAGLGALTWGVMQALQQRPYVRITRMQMCDQGNGKIKFTVKNFGSIEALNLKISLDLINKYESDDSLFPNDDKVIEIPLDLIDSFRKGPLKIVCRYATRLRAYETVQHIHQFSINNGENVIDIS